MFANSYFLILEQRVKIAHHLHYPHLSREQSSAAIPPRAVRWGPTLCTIGPFICLGSSQSQIVRLLPNGRLKKAVSELLLCYFIVKESQDLDHMHWILLYRSSTSRYILSISLHRKTFYCTWLLVAEITFKRPFLTLHFWGIFLFRFEDYICVSCFETWGICINLSNFALIEFQHSLWNSRVYTHIVILPDWTLEKWTLSTFNF